MIDFSEKLSDVKSKTKLPEGTFTNKAATIKKILVEHSKNKNDCIKKINFYINRAGKNLENKTEVMKAKRMIENMMDFSDLTERLQQVNFGLASEFGNFIEKYNAKIVNDYKVDTDDLKIKDGKIISTTTKTPIGKKIVKNFELSNGWIKFKVVIFENSKTCKCTLNTRDSLDTYKITYKNYLDFAKQFNNLLDEHSGCLYEIDKLNTEA